MTRERAKELLPVIQAFAEGKDIQYRYPNEQWEWETCRPPGCLEFTEAHEYRIKPEPRRFWIEVRGNEPSQHVVWFNNPKYVKKNPIVIEVVEVMDQ